MGARGAANLVINQTRHVDIEPHPLSQLKDYVLINQFAESCVAHLDSVCSKV